MNSLFNSQYSILIETDSFHGMEIILSYYFYPWILINYKNVNAIQLFVSEVQGLKSLSLMIRGPSSVHGDFCKDVLTAIFSFFL